MRDCYWHAMGTAPEATNAIRTKPILSALLFWWVLSMICFLLKATTSLSLVDFLFLIILKSIISDHSTI